MRCKLLMVTVIIALAESPASSQHDSLTLISLGSIQLPEFPIGVYIQDINNDSTNELVVNSDHYISVFNFNHELLWQNYSSTGNTRLQFYDINRDSQLDIIFNTAVDFRIYDPNHDSLIWAGGGWRNELLDFAIGYEDSIDEWPDLFILSKGASDMVDQDTFWIGCHEGPNFQEHYERPFPLWAYGINSVSYRESAVKLNALKMRFVGRLDALIWTDRYETGGVPPGNWNMSEDNGFTLRFDGGNLGAPPIRLETGRCLASGMTTILGQDCMYYLGSRLFSYGVRYGGYIRYTKWLSYSSPDGLLFTSSLYDSEYQDWNGFIIGDVSSLLPEDEICYSGNGVICLYSLSQQDTIWSINNTWSISSFPFIIHSSNIFGSSMIAAYRSTPNSQYVFINGNDGEIVGILSGGLYLKAVGDINSDGEDEIVVREGSSLGIYRLVPAGTDVADDLYPNQPALLSIYPNPFNSAATIEYSLPSRSSVSIGIYDIAGRKVGEMLEPERDVGTYRVQWNASGCSSGIYFCRMRAGERVFSQKMLYLK